MKTTLELPDELVREVSLRAEQEGLELTDAVARLLRKGLATTPPVTVDEEMLSRRKQVAEKFITGEWGVELEGYEAGRAADRASAREMTDRWVK
jgi:hypothetical protein